MGGFSSCRQNFIAAAAAIIRMMVVIFLSVVFILGSSFRDSGVDEGFCGVFI